MRSRVGFCALALLLPVATWGAAPAQACLHRKFTIDQMTRAAAQIVEGRVSEVTAAWNNDKTQIYTTVVLDVRAYHKGGPGVGKTEKTADGGTKLQISLLGGEVDDVGLLIVGAPHFAKDQDVFLFLSSRPDSGYPVFGMNEGFFEVLKDSTVGNPTLRGESLSVSRTHMVAEIHATLAPLTGSTVK